MGGMAQPSIIPFTGAKEALGQSLGVREESPERIEGSASGVPSDPNRSLAAHDLLGHRLFIDIGLDNFIVQAVKS